MDRKKIIMIAGGLILLALVSAAVYFGLAKGYIARRGAPPAPAEEAKAEPSAYEAADKTRRTAWLEKKPELCRGLPAELIDECIFNIASQNADRSFCGQIGGEQMKARCNELFLYREVVKEDDAAACLDLKEKDFYDQCLKEIFNRQDKLEYCGPFKDETKRLCEDLIYSKIANRDNKPDWCDKIADKAIKTNCQVMVKNIPKDSDHDGLADDYELWIATDPFRADTDGDGVPDGEELTRGLNPLVKGGKLNIK